MGCVASNSAIPQKQKDLDMYLEKEHLKSSLDFKILLLGAGESGKSTVVKQLRNIHLGKSAPSEIQSFAPVLHGNAIQAMRYAIKACENLNISLNDFEDSVKVVKEHSETNSISADEANLLDKLWQSPQMKEAWGKKSSVYIPDATPYYMSNIFRFIEKDFSPSEEDIIMARVRTTGMFMTSFDAPPIHWRVVDVGGQRSERKKQIRFFDDVHAILFIVNLAGYDQILFEDRNKNRMVESLELLEQVSKESCFNDTPFFLFLNKKDLFEELIRVNDISCLFSEYSGDKSTQDQLNFISEQFQQRMPNSKKMASVNFIAARMKRDVRHAFEDVKQYLIDYNQKKISKAVKSIEKIN